MIGGRWAGSLGGLLMAVPAVLHGEWATLPFGVLCGFVAGQLRTMARDKDDIWSFSPFIDLSIYRLIRRNLPTPRLFDWQIMFFTTIVGLRFVQIGIVAILSAFHFQCGEPATCGWKLAIYAASVMAIGIELKIFNSVRIQIKLEEQERLLLHARMEALQNQINPHFLVQHAEFDFLAGALRSGYRAGSDFQAGDDSAAAAEQQPILSCRCEKKWSSSTTIWTLKSCASGATNYGW